MHALMHELETLNAPHLPGYLGMFEKLRGKTTAAPAAHAAPEAPAAPTPSDAIWNVLDVSERKIVFQNAFKEMMTTWHTDKQQYLKQALESNTETKNVFLPYIQLKPQAR
jgi:hypothetical protein